MPLFSTRHHITPQSVIRRSKNLLFNEIDGEVVMLSIENSEYYGMDKIGSRIWELIENPVSVNELIGTLMDEYEVTREQCTNDTTEFLEQLAEKKLISIT
jgi:hypothetical protein